MSTLPDLSALERLLAHLPADRLQRGDGSDDFPHGYEVYNEAGTAVAECIDTDHAEFFAAARTHLPALLERARMAERLARALCEILRPSDRTLWDSDWAARIAKALVDAGPALSAARSAGLIEETEGEHG